jgi:hypothetical protein
MGEEGFRFAIVTRDGSRVAAAEHIEEATQLLRALPSGDRVIDVHSYKVMAFKRGRVLPSLVGQA